MRWLGTILAATYLAMLAVMFLYGIPAFGATVPDRTPTLLEWTQAEYKQHNGKLYLRVPIGDLNWCFTKNTDAVVSIQDNWQSMALLMPTTIPLSAEEYQVCTDTLPPAIWIVAKNSRAVDNPFIRPLKDGVTMTDTWRILVGLPCEPETVNVIRAGGQEYHWATNSDGMRGIAVCERAQ